MNNADLEKMLADVTQKINTNIQLSHVRGIDYSWRGRRYRWQLDSLRRSLYDLIEYNKHEHHNLTSFCRTPANRK